MICPYCGFAVMNANSNLKRCSRNDGAEHYFTVDSRTGVATREEKPAPVQLEPPKVVEHKEDLRTDDPPNHPDDPPPPTPPAPPVPTNPNRPKR